MRLTQARPLRIATHPAMVIFALFLAGFVVAWSWPKVTEDPGMHTVLYYRGFLLVESGILGPRFYELHINDGECVVKFTELGYNPFDATFPDGSLMGRGTCLVELVNGVPCPDFHDIKDADFYKPDGALASSVRNGNGVQVLHTPSGIKYWELELKDFKRAHLRMWYESGQLRSEQEYQNGVPNGPYVNFHENGNKRSEGDFLNGWNRVGKWRDFYADGRLEEESDNDEERGPPIRATRFEYGENGSKKVIFLERDVVQRVEHWRSEKLARVEYFKKGRLDRTEEFEEVTAEGKNASANPPAAVGSPNGTEK